ncbi:hypothetical protein G9X43_07605 [Cronobacter turicensis]|uniref:hypothetical protein n=1 Tax=Cronobacter turicensis TaxID=413502 RepID=UPI00141315CA|nr:hypothetical protein [Cronobacter turicensis]NHV08351.1 hypothetical protein [Cronobacter turicensis]NHV62763.1 hypothetical protein [Cronobacter turicensis]NHW09704.1 hypothetical protein [Cronobacter turicensis]
MNPLILRDDLYIKAVITPSGALRGVSLIRQPSNETWMTIIAQPCEHLQEQIARFLSLNADENATLRQFLEQFCERE